VTLVGQASPDSEHTGAAPTLGSPATRLLVAAAVTAGATVVASAMAAAATVRATEPGVWRTWLTALIVLLPLLALVTLRPLVAGVRHHRRSGLCSKAGDLPAARSARYRARQSAWVVMGCCLPLLLASAFVFFLLANDASVQRTFFNGEFIANSAGDVTRAFGQNIFIAVAAEVLVLVWGLVVAIGRIAPGPAGRPIRWLAMAYVDTFRAIPSIIVIYLVGFGLPLAEVPFFSALSPTWAAIVALSLTYGAYVAEVYRAGIESIHWSQVSAARSLGLSYGKTMRFVVVPQAFRRVTPPLLNDFIGLQKDTALVTVIGTVDAFTQAKTYASNYFNLSSVTVVAALFVLITIPQTRFVDRLLAKDAQRLRSVG
jgi:polar amino acid transport system permease protein